MTADAERLKIESRSLLDGKGGGSEDADPFAPPDPDPEMKEQGGVYTYKKAIWQVSIRCPLQGPLQLLALIWSFIPFVLPAIIFVHWLVKKHFIDLWALGIMIFAFILNEGILKPLCNQARPKLTANIHTDKDGKRKIKHGMPSGHVINSAAIMFWALCELLFSGPGFDEGHLEVSEIWLAIILVLTFPVPWARWYNLDHTLGQVSVSTVLGLIIGPGGYYIRHVYRPHTWHWWQYMMAEGHQGRGHVSV
jgi:hypothetical protein